MTVMLPMIVQWLHAFRFARLTNRPGAPRDAVSSTQASAPRFQRVETDAMEAILSALRNRSVLRDAILFAAANSHRRSGVVNTELMRALQSWLRPCLAHKTNTVYRLEVRILRP